MRAFSIVAESTLAPLTSLQKIATSAEQNHYWLDAAAVEELSGRGNDQQWIDQFRAMLASVAPYGYYDQTTNRVKAHVEYTNEPD